MPWRLAYSLDTLRSQVDDAYTGRSKASDGTIGDAAHQAVASDHNPNSAGVVTALDITDSPETGFDAHALADRLLAVRHPDLKYLISNHRIAGAWTNWQWVAYNGTGDPHVNHIHISVGRGADGYSTQPYDDRVQWNVEGEDMGRIQELEQIANDRQAYLDRIGSTVSVPAPVDGNGVLQIINNIKEEQARIDQLTNIVSHPTDSASKKLEQIRAILNK